MAVANIADTRTYYCVEGEGPPSFLHYGMTQSIERSYLDGYANALAPRFRLVTIDTRGHEKSDKPHKS